MDRRRHTHERTKQSIKQTHNHHIYIIIIIIIVHIGMKAEMGSLAQNMEGIAGRMRVVNAFLAGKRAKVRP